MTIWLILEIFSKFHPASDFIAMPDFKNSKLILKSNKIIPQYHFV